MRRPSRRRRQAQQSPLPAESARGTGSTRTLRSPAAADQRRIGTIPVTVTRATLGIRELEKSFELGEISSQILCPGATLHATPAISTVNVFARPIAVVKSLYGVA